MLVKDLVAALQEMPQDAEVVTMHERMELRDARVRLQPVGARSRYGTYSMPPEQQHDDGWVADLSVVLIS